MTISNIYFFEDAPSKRAAFKEVVALLEKAGKRRGIEIRDKLSAEYSANIEQSADLLAAVVERALTDPDGLILLDLHFWPKSYEQAGGILSEKFAKVVDRMPDTISAFMQELPAMHSPNQLHFAAVVLTLARHFKRMLFIASSGLRQRKEAHLIESDTFLRFPDSPGDVLQVGATVRRLATCLGFDANYESETNTRNEREHLVGEIVKALLQSLAKEEVVNNISQQLRASVRNVWLNLESAAQLYSPRLMNEVFSSSAAKSIRLLLTESDSNTFAKYIANFAGSLTKKPLFNHGDWANDHPILTALTKCATKEKKIILFGDFADESLLEGINVICQLNGHLSELRITNRNFELPKDGEISIIVWTASCQKQCLKSWLVVLNDFLGIKADSIIWVLEPKKYTVAFCNYLMECGALLLRSFPPDGQSLWPQKGHFKLKPFSKDCALGDELLRSITHGQFEVDKYAQFLHHLCPWMLTVKFEQIEPK